MIEKNFLNSRLKVDDLQNLKKKSERPYIIGSTFVRIKISHLLNFECTHCKAIFVHMLVKIGSNSKGQKISKVNYLVITSSEKQTKYFCKTLKQNWVRISFVFWKKWEQANLILRFSDLCYFQYWFGFFKIDLQVPEVKNS